MRELEFDKPEPSSCERWGHRGTAGTVCPDCGLRLPDFPLDQPDPLDTPDRSGPWKVPQNPLRDTATPLLLGALMLGLLQPWEVISRLESRT